MDWILKPLTQANGDDFFTFFDRVAFRDHPEWGCGCYCRFFHACDRVAWDARTPQENAAEARQAIQRGEMRGLLAYDGALPIGWCHFDRMANLPGLRAFYPALASDAPDCGAIVCFTVAQGYRRQGVAERLLIAALEALRQMGVPRVEAYPMQGGEDPEHQYHGPLLLYRKHGFTPVRQADGMVMVERTL